MLENFNEDKRKNSMTQFSDFHTVWSILDYTFLSLSTINNIEPFLIKSKHEKNISNLYNPIFDDGGYFRTANNFRRNP